MRLDKYIATTTDFSRSQVKKMIKSGDITVNNHLASDPSVNIDCSKDTVLLHGNLIQPPQSRYFMLHKPEGYICSTQDSENPIVLDLIHEPNSQTLQVAGRLDKETTGLVLITDDGQWNHRITAPRYTCFKRYQVSVAMPLSEELVSVFKQGMMLKSEKRPTLPAELIIHDSHSAEVLIQEGKYHQIRRMFAACGNHVTHLHRSHIGTISLDSQLKPGDYRPLQQEEINCFAE